MSLFASAGGKTCNMYITAGENIIATTKIRNNYSAIQLLNFLNFFYVAPCKVITLNPLCILFCISSLLLFCWLSL